MERPCVVCVVCAMALNAPPTRPQRFGGAPRLGRGQHSAAAWRCDKVLPVLGRADLLDVLGVDQRDDAVDDKLLLHLLVHEESLRYRRRVRQPAVADNAHAMPHNGGTPTRK